MDLTSEAKRSSTRTRNSRSDVDSGECPKYDEELHHANTPPNELSSQHCRHSHLIAVHSTPSNRMDSTTQVAAVPYLNNPNFTLDKQLSENEVPAEF
ncbi:hypothetical protein BLNAU_4893 [Blattamonas nauphoetae]|uniref:Uncharacterized protein n=1 Tax=Blattamonas nauphoetae TaxID=2049346 RepID=A0ABQ9Y8E2_9EUKA|nr:hypothetical protein BLNAU_4893 [Blattamonas nauphoetae]